MDRLVIQGGKRLSGSVTVSGAKNAVLPALAASLLTDQPCEIRRVPAVRDVTTMTRLLGTLGVSAEQDLEAHSCKLTAMDTRPCEASYHLVRQMRASICVLGPLVARRGKARVALPGGCQIGHRPIDLHLKGLAALGADVRIERGDVVVDSPSGLKGTVIDLAGPQGPTVTGTCNVLSAAVLASGRSILRNVAREPEVVDFMRLLRAMGARIDADWPAGILTVDGCSELGGASHEVIGDRIEAATWAAAAAATGSDIRILGIEPNTATATFDWLASLGVGVDVLDGLHSDETGWAITAFGRELRAADVVAAPYPGIPTDTQAQFAAVLTQANGKSAVNDTVFPDRFGYIGELYRLGADIRRVPTGAIINGPANLIGADVMASDLRASAALVIAALAAEGETVIRRIYHLDRGYETLDAKLTALGAVAHREEDEYRF